MKVSTRVAFIGEVDHGKSSLLSRLVTLTGTADGRGFSVVSELAHTVDQLAEERAAAMTIDTTEVQIKVDGRRFGLIDAPGHLELLKNMVTGVARADAAILVIDASEGVRPQTRRHLAIAQLLCCRRLAVAINKLDLCGDAAATLATLTQAIRADLGGSTFADAPVFGVSALTGDGAPTLLNWITADGGERSGDEAPTRFVVQSVVEHEDGRLVTGVVASGKLRVGQTLSALPGDAKPVVRRIIAFPKDRDCATVGDSIALSLTEGFETVRRGSVLGEVERPPMSVDKLAARIVWLAESPLSIGDRITLRCSTQRVAATVDAIAVDAVLAAESADPASLSHGELAEVSFSLASPMVVDRIEGDTRDLSRVVIERDGRIVSGGIVP